MAYAALPAKGSSDTLDLADYNKIKGNFEAGAPDTFTTKGDLYVATAADAGTRLAAGANDSALVADSAAGGGLAWQIQPAVRVYNNADIDPATSTWVALTFNTERYDTDGMHSTVANTGRLTVPAGGAGIYHIGANVEFGSAGGAGSIDIGVRVMLNGSATVIVKDQGDKNRVGWNITVPISCDYELAVADYIELQVYTEANIDIKYFASYVPDFWAHWIRRPPP